MPCCNRFPILSCSPGLHNHSLLAFLPLCHLRVFLASDEMMEENEFKGFPVVLDKESQLLEGFVTRLELKSCLGRWQATQEYSAQNWDGALFSRVTLFQR